MSSWGYVALAYAIVWGSLALYALFLARRVTQSQKVERQLQEGLAESPTEQQNTICDAPPGH